MPLPPPRQSLLTSYFHSKCGRTRYLTFLDLPLHIRERIYNDACREERHWVRETIFIWDYEYGDFNIAASLMLTCRTVYNEVFRFVYSRNRIVIYGGTQEGLNVLRRISNQALGVLSEVTVHLAINRPATPPLCHFKGFAYEHCGRHCRTQAQVLALQHVHLERWHSVLREVLPHLPRENFRMYIICNMEAVDLDLADSISLQLLAPLHGRLTLSSCSVQLGESPNMRLRNLAEEIALRATGHPGPVQQRLTFLSLPHELRILILRWTDLVAPRKEVEFRPGRGYWASDRGRCDVYTCDLSPEFVFCRRAHAAFSARCDCWIMPQPLFLLCKIVRREAEQVFFRENRIVIKPAAGINCLADATPRVLEASTYLKNVIPAHALRHLRVLEIVFSPLKGAWLQEHEPAYRDWLSTLDFVKDKLSYSKLTLRVAFSAWAPNHASYGPIFYPEPSEESIRGIYESYKRILFPLAVLREHGLVHLQLDLASPSWLHVGHGETAKDELRRRAVESTRTEIETRVMGEGHTETVTGLGDSLWKLVWTDHALKSGCEYEYDDPTMDFTNV
jgi:hypothetical protein